MASQRLIIVEGQNLAHQLTIYSQPLPEPSFQTGSLPDLTHTPNHTCQSSGHTLAQGNSPKAHISCRTHCWEVCSHIQPADLNSRTFQRYRPADLRTSDVVRSSRGIRLHMNVADKYIGPTPSVYWDPF